MDRIATLIEAMDSESADGALVTIEPKIFEVPEAMAMEDTLLAADEWRSFLTEMRSAGDVTSVAYPSVVTRNAQRATIESVVEQQVPISIGGFMMDKTGSAIELEPFLDGELVRITGSVDQGFVPGQSNAPLEPGATRIHPESPIVHHTVDFDAHIGPGEAALFSMPGAEPGKVLIYVIEANRN